MPVHHLSCNTKQNTSESCNFLTRQDDDFLSAASGKPRGTQGLYLNSDNTSTSHKVQIKSLVLLNGLPLLLIRPSTTSKGTLKGSKHDQKRGENNFSCWEDSPPRWDRTRMAV